MPGMALLAAYLIEKSDNETLEDFLSEKVFSSNSGSTVSPDPDDVEGFNSYIARYKNCLAVERAAVETL